MINEIESIGFKNGENPFFGEWEKKFNFPPISYSNKSSLKQEFKDKIRENLNVNYVYSHQVTLKIDLYLNEEKMLETPEYGDLDNYAKSICDALKGHGGILIDDCQIQRLEISWIDVPTDSSFEIRINSSPDDFIPASFKLYEMSNGLFYPVSNYVWNEGRIEKSSFMNQYLELNLFDFLSGERKKAKHSLRQEGKTQAQAFQGTKNFLPIPWGFHKTRVIDSGYKLINHQAWCDEYQSWLLNPENKDHVETFEKIFELIKKKH